MKTRCFSIWFSRKRTKSKKMKFRKSQKAKDFLWSNISLLLVSWIIGVIYSTIQSSRSESILLEVSKITLSRGYPSSNWLIDDRNFRMFLSFFLCLADTAWKNKSQQGPKGPVLPAFDHLNFGPKKLPELRKERVFVIYMTNVMSFEVNFPTGT